MAPVLCSSAPQIKIGHVDDVQELWRSGPAAVPERYIREVEERPVGSPVVEASVEIPVIDMSKLVGCGLQAQLEMAKLNAACEEWGFFQVVNHDVEIELMRRMEEVCMEFFMLPLEEKEKYPMAPGTIQGYGHAFVFSEEQKLDWCNMLALGVEPSFIRNPKLWPTNPANFSETLEVYSDGVGKLSQELLVLIARSLQLDPERFNDMFGTAVQAARMNYYPRCPRPDLVLGLSPHSDGSALTVLQQDTRSVGLQVLKDGNWVPIQPIPNAFVVNIGDTIEVLTNGKYKSVEHRVVTSRDTDRLSVVTFYAPGYNVEIGPLPEFTGESRPSMYRRYNHGDYSRHYVTNRLQGKKTLDFARIDVKSSA